MGTHPIFESDFDCLTENVAPFYSKNYRNLRACLICSMVKTLDQFDRDGCDNCERFLKYRGNRDMVIECTSASFDGLIGMMNPDQSWVAKWQRIEKFTPGMYAISVNG